jgi:hypothetical protein
MAGWTAPRTWVTSEVVTAAELNSNVRDNLLAINPTPIKKTADQSVTSSTTLVNDTHLSYAVVAGTYIFDWYLVGTSAANAAGDIGVAWTYPTASLALAMGNGPDAGLASGGIQTGQWSANSAITSGTLFNTYGLSTNNITIWLHNIFTFTASGTVQLQWAQASSSASASTLKTGSHVVPRQIA